MDHICVKDCNVSRLVIPSQTGKQSNTLFLKNQFWGSSFQNDLTPFLFPEHAYWTLYTDGTTELQSWFKSNYLRHLRGEESNTKSITIINHDTIWLNHQAGKVKRTCFYCLFLVFIYYLFIYFLHFFDLDFLSVRIQRKKITWQISSRLSCPHA